MWRPKGECFRPLSAPETRVFAVFERLYVSPQTNQAND